MKNPLRKRILRELKEDAGKYAVIFILLAAMIGFVSGFLIADGSMRKTYDASFSKYRVEDGYFDVKDKLDDSKIESLEKNQIQVYENFYIEKELSDQSTLRIYQNREQVDKVCLMDGAFPKSSKEIAIDRMYAENNQLEIGDTITAKDASWKVVGLVALSDYSALFSDNSDTMFDAVKFGVAIVNEDGFAALGNSNRQYRYAWTYANSPADDTQAYEKGEDLMKAMGKVITLESFVPRYQNQAIVFTRNDMGSDQAMMTILLYMLIGILAFVFAITISNTITKEATTIGTLRALGYTRMELVRHYLTVPILVTLVAALCGNILGYTILEKVCCDMYYASYSLTKYETVLNGDALIKTTIIPIFMMLVINFLVLSYKMKLEPLKFIRRDLARRKQNHAVRLDKRIRFFDRFRMRIIFQNISNYVILLVGILFANLLLMFGLALPVVLDNYQTSIQDNLLCKYQYMLNVPVELLSTDSKVPNLIAMLQYSMAVETDTKGAEKFAAYSLNTTSDLCDSEEILLYGISDNSQYVSADVKDGQVYVSKDYADKYGLKKGDTIRLKEKYKSDSYRFKISGVYDYEGSLSVFMSQEKLNETLNLDKDYFSGYFSNRKITDINSKYLGSVIDLESLTKVSRQLDVSMGQMMYLVDGFAILIFVVLIYLLSKIVIEKNGASISMTKILGYWNGEIARLYIVSTSIMVVLFLLGSLYIDYQFLKVIFREMMTMEMSGWIPLKIDASVYVKMMILGVSTYGLVAVLEMWKIKKVPMDEALKLVE